MPAPRLSDFTVVGHLGDGGTARVSEVRSALYGRNKALKQPLKDDQTSHEEFTSLILRENHLIGQDHFPGLVRLRALATGDQPFLVMELCQGSTLGKLGRVDDPIEVMNLISALAVDLEYLRLRGLVHCDLKPDNIFLPGDYSEAKDKLYYLKVSDFSLGRLVNEEEQARAGLGTVGYMPPETTNSRITSHRSDLFALGVIAYQLITGHHPFAENESDPVKINGRVQEETPREIKHYRSDIPETVVDLINKLLSKNPGHRPQSAWTVCRTLEENGAGYPFRSALHPRYLIAGKNKDQSPENFTWLKLEQKQHRQLICFCGTDRLALNLLITANYRKGRLFYDGSHFTSRDDLYWPLALRKTLLKSFSGLSLSEKKESVRRAIASRAQTEGLYDSTNNAAIPFPESFYDLLLNLLRAPTIMRTAHKIAREADKKEDHLTAAYLYPVSGDLASAEESAFQAANQLKNDDHPEQAIGILKQTIELARLKDELPGVRQLLMLLGGIYKSIGETERAEAVYDSLLDLYEHLQADKLLAETYKGLGEINRVKKKFETGLGYLNDALRIFNGLDDELEVSRTYNNIGNVYFTTSDYKSALLNYRRALRIKRRINDEHDLGQTLNNIGTVFGARGNYTRAKVFFEFSLTLNKKLGRKVEIARTLNNLGYTYFYCGELDRATECLMEAFKINKGIGTKNELLFNYENLTSVMLISGRLEQTAEHLGEAKKLAEQLGNIPHVAAFSLGLSSVYRRMGKYSRSMKVTAHARSLIESLDDTDLKIRLQLEQAENSFDLGYTQSALEKAQKALRMAEEADQMPSVLSSLLLLTKINYDEEHFQKAHEIISQLKLKREKLILYYNRLEHETTRNTIKETKSVSEINIGELEKIETDVELPRYCNIAADLMRQQGEAELAKILANRALAHAQRSSQRPEIVRSCAILGLLHKESKEYEESYRLFRKALEHSKEIISEIDNQNDQQTYQSTKIIKLLIVEIKKLAQLMNQQK